MLLIKKLIYIKDLDFSKGVSSIIKNPIFIAPTDDIKVSVFAFNLDSSDLN